MKLMLKIRFGLDPLTLNSFVYIVPIRSRSQILIILEHSLFPNPNHVPSNTRFAFPFHNREVATSGASALSSYTKPLLSIHSAKSVHKDLLYTAAACFTGLHKDRAPKVDVNQQ